MGLCVRQHRYALAMTAGSLAAGVLGLHECDNPVCVKVAADGQVDHVVVGPRATTWIAWSRCGVAVADTLCAAAIAGAHGARVQ
jgi:hypothetical protein